MHPEILRELSAQRGREMQARAQQAALARAASRVRRALRRGTDPSGGSHGAEEFVLPAIPDYADGSFRTAPADEKVASEAGQVPASRNAA
ncbi:MAG TPA: hypothetical protein VIY52_27520 [Streptosporangiaceae bacterium]